MTMTIRRTILSAAVCANALIVSSQSTTANHVPPWFRADQRCDCWGNGYNYGTEIYLYDARPGQEYWFVGQNTEFKTAFLLNQPFGQHHAGTCYDLCEILVDDAGQDLCAAHNMGGGAGFYEVVYNWYFTDSNNSEPFPVGEQGGYRCSWPGYAICEQGTSGPPAYFPNWYPPTTCN